MSKEFLQFWIKKIEAKICGIIVTEKPRFKNILRFCIIIIFRNFLVIFIFLVSKQSSLNGILPTGMQFRQLLVLINLSFFFNNFMFFSSKLKNFLKIRKLTIFTKTFLRSWITKELDVFCKNSFISSLHLSIEGL